MENKTNGSPARSMGLFLGDQDDQDDFEDAAVDDDDDDTNIRFGTTSFLVAAPAAAAINLFWSLILLRLWWLIFRIKWIVSLQQLHHPRPPSNAGCDEDANIIMQRPPVLLIVLVVCWKENDVARTARLAALILLIRAGWFCTKEILVLSLRSVQKRIVCADS